MNPPSWGLGEKEKLLPVDPEDRNAPKSQRVVLA